MEKKFNPKKLAKLNNPDRLNDVPPALVLDVLNIQAADVLVDIGAGTGFYSIPFQQLTGGKVYACDISDTMLEWMTENIVPTHPNIIPYKMQESSTGLPDAVADLVFMINLHHELDDPAALLSECFRILKPNGRIAIIDWKKEEMEQGPPVEIRCDVSLVIHEIKATGFKQVEAFQKLKKHFLIIGEKSSSRSRYN